MNSQSLFIRILGILALAAAFLVAVLAPAVAGPAPAAPAWRLVVNSAPTNLAPHAAPPGVLGAGPRYYIRATNVGEVPATGPIVITDTLPAGVTPAIESAETGCSAIGQVVTCTTTETIYPGGILQSDIAVEVESLPDPTVLEPNEVTITSPGAAPITRSTPAIAAPKTLPSGSSKDPTGWAPGCPKRTARRPPSPARTRAS